MKVVIAIDSFKGSLSSVDAGMAAAEGIKKAIPEAETIVRPVADGGEGTVDALCYGLGGLNMTVDVTGPLGDKVKAGYGIVPSDRTAIIEISSAAGITLVEEDKRNPMYTTTYGVGEIISDAIDKGCRNFIIGIGGSATNDGGIGMLQALGFELLGSDGNAVSYGAQGLSELVSINFDKVNPKLRECSFYIACDVTNPLCGKNGCSNVFGPQKGADTDMILKMDAWLHNYAELAKTYFPFADEKEKGAGAAGGLGFAFMTFMNAELKGGIELVLDKTHLEDFISQADVVVTGEGRLDGQTSMGKAPSGIAKLAKKYNKKVIAFAGAVARDAYMCNSCGIDAFFPVLRNVCTLEEAMNTDNAYQNLTDCAEQVFRLLNS